MLDEGGEILGGEEWWFCRLLVEVMRGGVE